MRRFGRLALLFPLLLAVTASPSRASEMETVPLYTSDDLDRMFGPAPDGPSVPVDKTRAEDWAWVEQFIDRQYARVDADRQYDLDRRALDIAERRVEPVGTGYYRPLAWGLGYPASTWWNGVWGRYATSVYGGCRVTRSPARSVYARATGELTHPMGEMPRRGGRPGGHGHARRAK
jgi:hypothetical protein